MLGAPSQHFQKIAISAPLDKISCGLKALSRPRSRYSRGGGISLGVPASWDGSCGGDGRRGGDEIILPRGGGRRGGGETIPRGCGGYAAVGDDERAIFFCLGGISFNPHAIIFVFGTVLSFKNCFHVHTRFFIAVSFFSAVGFFCCVASLALGALASRRPQRPVDSWSVHAFILRC